MSLEDVDWSRLDQYLAEKEDVLTARQRLRLNMAASNFKSREEGVSDEVVDYQLWCEDGSSRMTRFRDFLLRVLQRYEAQNILEVGCGTKALLAQELRTRGYRVCAMDPALECENDWHTRKAFDFGTDLTSYDIVIAQEPCEAAELIIRACVAVDKPFWVQPCGDAHRMLSGEKPRNAMEWWRRLAIIDRRVEMNFMPMLDELGYLVPILHFLC